MILSFWMNLSLQIWHEIASNAHFLYNGFLWFLASIGIGRHNVFVQVFEFARFGDGIYASVSIHLSI